MTEETSFSFYVPPEGPPPAPTVDAAEGWLPGERVRPVLLQVETTYPLAWLVATDDDAATLLMPGACPACAEPRDRVYAQPDQVVAEYRCGLTLAAARGIPPVAPGQSLTFRMVSTAVCGNLLIVMATRRAALEQLALDLEAAGNDSAASQLRALFHPLFNLSRLARLAQDRQPPLSGPAIQPAHPRRPPQPSSVTGPASVRVPPSQL